MSAYIIPILQRETWSSERLLKTRKRLPCKEVLQGQPHIWGHHALLLGMGHKEWLLAFFHSSHGCPREVPLWRVKSDDAQLTLVTRRDALKTSSNLRYKKHLNSQRIVMPENEDQVQVQSDVQSRGNLMNGSKELIPRDGWERCWSKSQDESSLKCSIASVTCL